MAPASPLNIYSPDDIRWHVVDNTVQICRMVVWAKAGTRSFPVLSFNLRKWVSAFVPVFVAGGILSSWLNTNWALGAGIAAFLSSLAAAFLEWFTRFGIEAKAYDALYRERSFNEVFVRLNGLLLEEKPNDALKKHLSHAVFLSEVFGKHSPTSETELTDAEALARPLIELHAHRWKEVVVRRGGRKQKSPGSPKIDEESTPGNSA